MTDKEIELNAKIDWLQIELEHYKAKIAEALHQIHERKECNAIQILNHLWTR